MLSGAILIEKARKLANELKMHYSMVSEVQRPPLLRERYPITLLTEYTTWTKQDSFIVINSTYQKISCNKLPLLVHN